MFERIGFARIGRLIVAGMLAVGLSACATSGPSPLPQGAAAYGNIPEKVEGIAEIERINAGDKLQITVFGESELSAAYLVDSVGYLRMPLVGELIAQGMTPRELGEEIARRLGARYIRNPDVTVSITDRPRSTYTVEGDVNGPGVFEATPGSTLLSAMAQAKSPTKTAKTNEVMIFRMINGKRSGGRFDLVAIRRGRAADPQVLPGDTIVVGNSAVKSAWRDFLAALPVFNLFTQF